MKFLSKLILGLFASLFVLAGCENEDLDSVSPTADSEFAVIETTISEVSKKTSLPFLDKSALSSGGYRLRTGIATQNGFIYLLDDKVTLSTYMGVTAYTFPIENTSDNPEAFQNLVVNTNAHEQSRYFIFYVPSVAGVNNAPQWGGRL